MLMRLTLVATLAASLKRLGTTGLGFTFRIWVEILGLLVLS